ncbi:hypothetical protein GALL_552420 [mine drainage metagenome]|uniref:Uncharacterized protein n=1 Tax=mine drainage metagenome TaxID=410659 RepID=A0A1J5NVH7_9ZZZZ
MREHLLGTRDQRLNLCEFLRILPRHLLERRGHVLHRDAGELGKLAEKAHLRDLRRSHEPVEITLPGFFGFADPLFDSLGDLRMLQRLLYFRIQSVDRTVAALVCGLARCLLGGGLVGLCLVSFRQFESVQLGGVGIVRERFGTHRIDPRGECLA